MSAENEKIDSKKIVEQVIQNVMTQNENENENECKSMFVNERHEFIVYFSFDDLGRTRKATKRSGCSAGGIRCR